MILFLILFHLPSFAELDRWQKWELERNDLHANPLFFQALPDKNELRSYQTDTLLVVELDFHDVGFISTQTPEDRILNFVKTPEGKLRFFIHPKATELFPNLMKKGQVKSIKATPTTSPRTFFVDDFLVKVSLPQKINGAIRTVYPLQMQRATLVNDLLKKTHVHYLNEPLGIYDKTPDSPFGFLIREIPKKFISGSNTLVPLLSYVATHADGSLLKKNAESLQISTKTLIITKILPALLESFYEAVQHGIAIEAHQQNTLLELDQHGHFTGNVYYRDLDGCRVDFNLRRKLGFNDQQIKSMPDFDWIFDTAKLTELTRMNYPLKKRPPVWSGPIEKSYQMYLLGSSVDLLQKSVLDINLEEEALRQTSNLRSVRLCRQVLL